MIKHIVNSIEGLENEMIDDLIVGNAVQEAEQGMQMGRMISLMALGIDNPGMVINRYCGSGLEALYLASAKIQTNMADLVIAGGTESMSLVPTMGWKTALNYSIASGTPSYYTSMGQTAEQIAEQFRVSREDQDEFAYNSHMKAVKAQEGGKFEQDILPITVSETYVDADMMKKSREHSEAVGLVLSDGAFRWSAPAYHTKNQVR